MPSHRHILLGLAALLSGPLEGTAAQTVKVTNGTIQGVKCSDTNVNSFLGIPYANRPTRFAAPEPYNSTYGGNNTLQATTPAPICPQFGTSFLLRGKESEDCLFLDVYAPATATSSSKLPVKVWLHGGFNEADAAADPTYNGCFAASNAILVRVNYRLGPLGWLALPDFGISGNFGTLDQLQALAWVQENIASFGGDPSRVLLFGQSAGAADSFVLATLPQAPKLFSAVALESGAGRSLPTIQQVIAWNKYFATAGQVACTNLDCLRSVEVEHLNATELDIAKNTPRAPSAETLLLNFGKGPTWSPVIDGTIIPTAPLTAGLRVPAIIGSNTREGTLLLLATYGARALSLNSTDYATFLTSNFGPDLAATINNSYPLSSYPYHAPPPAPDPLPPPQAFLAIADVITNYAYRCPARAALRSASQHNLAGAVWTYSFNHTPSCPWSGAIPPGVLDDLGATHTAEIPFVFNLTRNLPPGTGSDGCNFTQAEEQVAGFLLGAWDSMAREGRPIASGGNNNESAWPVWSERSGRAPLGLVVGDEGVSVGEVDYSGCDFWDGISEKVAAAAKAENGTTPTGTGTGGIATPTPSGQSGENKGGKVEVGGWALGVAVLVGVSGLV